MDRTPPRKGGVFCFREKPSGQSERARCEFRNIRHSVPEKLRDQLEDSKIVHLASKSPRRGEPAAVFWREGPVAIESPGYMAEKTEP